MKLRKIALLGMSCLLALGLTAGAVYASTNTSNSTPSTTNGNRHEGYAASIAQLLGMDATTLRHELKSGKTLSQIAATKGIDTNTLTQKLKSAFNERIDKAVTNGKLTATKATQIKANEASEIAKKINQPWTGKEYKYGFDKGIGQTVSSVLGMDVTQIKEQLKSGKTLAQLAADKGISNADLTAKLQVAMEANIDQALKENKITSDKATQLKAKLPQMINRMINKSNVKK